MVTLLFLDDMYERTDQFIDWFKASGEEGDRLDVVSDAQEAIGVLQENGPFDTLFLDHDLGDEHYEGTTHNEGCGCAVLEAALSLPTLPREIVIHSWNGPAVGKMVGMVADFNKQGGEVKVAWSPFGPGLRGFLRPIVKTPLFCTTITNLEG